MLKRIALCMIVKNEERIIRRCLAAARPIVDYACIVDTGSSDGTIEEINRALRELSLPGEVHKEAWRDFAHNRSSALATLRKKKDIDYALMIDADDSVALSDNFDAASFKASLSDDLIYVWTKLGENSYVRPQLISNRKPFFFKGVLHEFLDCSTAFTQSTTDAFVCQSLQDSKRNENPNKYAADARLLESSIGSVSDPFLKARYTFYAAQSWRDCGDHERAMLRYMERSQQGFWDQEVYVSLWQAGLMSEALGRPDAELLGLYLKAFDVCPSRAEALHAAAKLCRVQSRFQTGYLLAKAGLNVARPKDGLFLADWIYNYGVKDELAVLAYWTERYDECLALCTELLASPHLPDSDRERVTNNAQFASEKLVTGFTPRL